MSALNYTAALLATIDGEYSNRIVEFLYIVRWWLFYGSAALLGLLIGWLDK